MSNAGARAIAVAVSVLLHAGAAGLLFLHRDARAPSAPDSQSVELGVEYTRAEPAGPGEPVAEKPRAAAARPAHRAAAAEPSPAGSASGSSVEEASPAAVTTDEAGAIAVAVADGAAEGASSGGNGAGPGAGAEGAGGMGSGAGEGIGLGAGDDDTFARISRRLAEQAVGCYPAPLARFRATGTVHVRFSVGADGQPREAAIAKSSGVTLFDDAALRCVLQRAVPLPATRELVVVPILFRVRGSGR